MKILVFNIGSTTIKFQLFHMPETQPVCVGIVEKIGTPSPEASFKYKGEKHTYEVSGIQNHEQGVAKVIDILLDSHYGILKSLDEIKAVGHRVVHGGKYFFSSVIVDEDVKDKIQKCFALAPLHNPNNLGGILAAEKLFPKAKQVAVFDTAFHQTMPAESYLYAIDESFYRDYGVRKYGFHGISYQYVSQTLAEKMNKPLESINAIIAHMGGGVSITALKDGKSYETSMGMTPLAGMVMATRSGDIDPLVLYYLHDTVGLSWEEIEKLLNHKSGLLGISGLSSDCREIEDAARAGNQKAQLALDIFIHRACAIIGSYMALLPRLDALVFTAGIGENSQTIRQGIISRLSHLGFSIDAKKNQVRGEAIDISDDKSKISVWIVPTNEELMIAKETERLLRK